MNISYIIPNYNGKHLLTKNLPYILETAMLYQGGRIEIIISDDHSTDGSYSYLTAFVHKRISQNIEIIVIQNTGDKGFSKNVNFAVKHASGDILLLLNTDVMPQKDFLSPLLPWFEHEKVFAVGCLEKTEDKGVQVNYGRSVGRFVRGFIQHSVKEGEGNSTFWVSCGSGAFRKSLWDKMGGLDEIYNPFYWEDIDLSYRAVKSGYRIIFESKSIVKHEHQIGAIKSTFSQTRIKAIAYRNQFIFMWKNITDSSLQVQHILWLPYYILTAVIHADQAFLQGFSSAIFLLPKIIQSRTRDKKAFMLSDKQVLYIK